MDILTSLDYKHFQRVFSVIAGEDPADAVWNRYRTVRGLVDALEEGEEITEESYIN